MNAQEWPLVIFTILAQMSVGSFLILGLIYFLANRKYPAKLVDQQTDLALLAIGPVLVAALLASLFHLGTVFNAYYAVANVATSWLSREILFGVLFAGLGGLFAIMQWRKIGSFAVRNIIAWIAALVGIALVYIMAQVYMLPTQPAWNTPLTTLSFFTTTLLLGGLAVGAALMAASTYLKRKSSNDSEDLQAMLRNSLRLIAILSVVMLGVEFVINPLRIAQMTSQGGAAAQSAATLMGEFGLLYAVRLVLVFLGAGVLALFAFSSTERSSGVQIAGLLIYGAFAVVLISEILGRYLFYATQVTIGL